MGMLIEGRWSDEDQLLENGRYKRPKSVYGEPVDPEMAGIAAAQPGRFWLIASASCPWSHRAVIVRTVRRLEQIVPMHLAHGSRVEGYAVDGGRDWPVPGSGRKIRHMHQLYTLGETGYSGRVTVPVLWDSAAQRIVSNESMEIVLFMNRVESGADCALFPEECLAEQNALQERMQHQLNNGVYRAGFAADQSAYDEAVSDAFSFLDEMDERLAASRYLMGQAVTFADWQLFVSLVRFDSIYFILHRCCLRRLVDYPNLWAYMRDLAVWPGVWETIDWQAMRRASYANDTAYKGDGILPVRPEADWHAPHGREGM